ncbi:MAG: PDC sensor domain-containing protein [Helicobacteraceae bacterium]|nr:PDC sensor domain-containing protein [Helicobacteraceae bacterium]
MLGRDIDRYSKLRYEIRAYMCFILEQNIKNYMPNISLDIVKNSLQRISNEIKTFNALYILDKNGILLGDIIGSKVVETFYEDKDFSNRSYYYETLREKKCILTDPYPSKIGGKLVVTATYPCYNEDNEIICIACIDILLEDALNLVSPASLYGYFSVANTIIYSVLSIALSLIATLLLIKGLSSLITATWNFKSLDIKEIFESTILLTLSLAIFDLVKAIFEEEVLGKNSNDNKTIHKTMMRFLGSIIIAIAIEALMLVFKFTITQPDKLIYAVYLMGGVFLLLLGLSVYVKFAYGALNLQKKARRK